MGIQSEIDRTGSGMIPKDWQTVRLGDGSVAEIRGNKKIGEARGVAFIPMELIPDSSVFAAYEVRSAGKVTSYTYCERGDLLLAKITPSLENGKQGIVPHDVPNGFAVATTEVFAISCKGIDTLFLFYVLKSPRFRNRIISSMTGTTGRQRASKESVDNLLVPLPSPEEQRKIAFILYTVDQAIEKVKEAIEKTRRLEKGLMQRLLTRGIGHRESKETEIGRIPSEWGVKELEEVALINRESRDPARECPDGRFFYVDIDSVENGTGVFRNVREVVGKDAPSRARRVVRRNDVIMSTVRPYLKAFAIVPKTYDNQISSTGFAVLTCKQNILPIYLLYALFSDPFVQQCNKAMVGGQYPALNSSQVARIKVPIPSLLEQQKIAEILSTVDRRLELLTGKKQRLERTKAGLMNELLTGRRRVKLTP
jgi:type I restriction enzyme, S subunit